MSNERHEIAHRRRRERHSGRGPTACGLRQPRPDGRHVWLAGPGGLGRTERAASRRLGQTCRRLHSLAACNSREGDGQVVRDDQGGCRPKAQGLEASACGYNGTTDGQQGFAIKVFYGNPPATFSFLAGIDSTEFGKNLTTNVPGIGDEALTDGSDDLAVQYGNDVVYIEDVSEPSGANMVPLGQMEQLSAMVHAAMK